MEQIRKATWEDVYRIAELMVFTKRVNYRRIFNDDQYCFIRLSVPSILAELREQPEILERMWVYDDGLVKGVAEIGGGEMRQLYVEEFFHSQGIGGKLLRFGVEEHGVRFLWVLEENHRARAFYERHGFTWRGEWELGKETGKKLLKMER